MNTKLQHYWKNYQEHFEYVKDITFDEVMIVCRQLIDKLIKYD
ncbi:hypothetical protein [Tuanshanicoccus yangjingiae]